MNTGASLLLDQPIAPASMLGVVVGVVEQTTDDPMQLGRILVHFPTLGIGSAWARIASFAAGPSKGAYFLPAAKDEVLVAFEQGDTSQPYVIGALWNGVDTPPVPADKIQTVRQIQSSAGSYLQFDDTQDGIKITVADKNNNTIVIDTQNNTITITSTGKLNITAADAMTVTAKTLSIQANSIEIAATESSLSLSSQENTSMLANGEITLNGTMINLN